MGKGSGRDKDRFVIDTSAILSLASMDILKETARISELTVTPGVLKELEDISANGNDLGRTANRILKLKKELTVETVEIVEKIPYLHETDNECYNLAKRDGLVLVTDDLRAIHHMADKVETRFSTFFLVALIKIGVLTKRKGLELLERVRDVRSWENNILYVKTRKSIEALKV